MRLHHLLKTHAPMALACFLFTASPALAGTIRADRLDTTYRSYANEPQFAAVGRYSAGSASGSFTLIAPQWALTAAHVVDTNLNADLSDDAITSDTLTIGGITRHATEAIVPVGMNGNRGWDGNINAGFDLALVRLDSPITTIAPAKLYTSFQELGKQITSVGFGQGGTGKTGATGSSGTKRAGDNVVDQLLNFSNGLTGLRYDFDEPSPRTSPNVFGSSAPLDLEYSIAPGDSGGGSFIFEDGQWLLAGVNSGIYNFFNYPGATSDNATYGDGVLLTRLSAYQQFIASNIPELASILIPEPTSMALLALAACAGAVRPSRRRAR